MVDADLVHEVEGRHTEGRGRSALQSSFTETDLSGDPTDPQRLVEMVADPGDELGDFLKQGRELAAAEGGTVTWYAFRLSDTTYGIFDTFEGEDDRQAHLNGQIPAALGQVGPDLLASDPDIRPIDILAVK